MLFMWMTMAALRSTMFCPTKQWGCFGFRNRQTDAEDSNVGYETVGASLGYILEWVLILHAVRLSMKVECWDTGEESDGVLNT